MKYLFVLLALIFCAPNIRGAELAEIKRLAEDGDARAALSLGMIYRDGRGVQRDFRKALKWYRVCADLDDADGLDNVGFMYLRGWGVKEDFGIATAYFKASAKQNHAQGLFNLGNSYFSGQGVEQDYDEAIKAWKRAATQDHAATIWRLATLFAAGEGVPQNRSKAIELCKSIASKGDVYGMLLLGELHFQNGDEKLARKSWSQAAKRGSARAEALLQLAKWRGQKPKTGQLAYVEVDHLYQGWNNCGATSIAMLARHMGCDTSPYDVKRLCPRSPIGTGTDWADLVAAGEKLGQDWKLVTFARDDAGFVEGTKMIRQHLDADRPVVIDFTVVRQSEGKTEHFGHTLLVVGYNNEADQFVLKNPNQPPPGIELMSAEELKANWYSRGYSRFAKGVAARPLIVSASAEVSVR